MGGGAAADAGFVVPAHGQTAGWRGLFANRKALGIATFASLGGVLYGYNQGVFAQVQVMYDFETRFASVLGPEVNSIQRGMLTSILELAAMVGALIAGPVSDRVSRKFSIAGWCLVFMLGTALQAGARGTNVDFVWAGRWFAGMGVGALSMLVPMYNGELAPPGIRGSLVALQQLAITFGILISYWIAYGTNYIGRVTDADGNVIGQSEAAWRIPLAIQLVPAIILFAGCFFLPYSPRWLMLRGREEEALLTLANLRNMPAEHLIIQTEYMGLQAERLVQEEELKERYGPSAGGFSTSVREYIRLLTTKTLLHRLSLGVAAQSLQQWSGINAIIYYAPIIFEQVGLTGGTISILATGIVGVVNFVMTIPAVLYVDNFGRKPLLFFGATSMAISLAIVAALIAQKGPVFTDKSAGNAAVFFIYWFIASFAVTWGPLAWVVSAEVFPLNMRAKGMSISSAANWLMNFVVGLVTPVMITNIGYKTYIVFMVFMIIAMLWSSLILPELKGKTLEEVDAAFDDNAGVADQERRDRIARQIGLDKVVAEVQHDEGIPNREKV